MAYPSDFNDPFEARPCIVPLHADPTMQKRAERQYVSGVLKKNKLPFRKRLRLITLKPYRFQHISAQLPDTYEKNIAEMRRSTSIVCLSSEWKRPIQWSHYADGHRGICVHLNGNAWPWRLAQKIEYSSGYPKLEVPVPEDRTRELIEKTLLVKDEDWSYESEFRLLKPRDTKWQQQLRGNGVSFDGVTMKVPTATIVGVTLGAEMEDSVRDEFLSELALRKTQIEIYQARLASNRYEIERERLQCSYPR
jgi:hypothetical protein